MPICLPAGVFFLFVCSLVFTGPESICGEGELNPLRAAQLDPILPRGKKVRLYILNYPKRRAKLTIWATRAGRTQTTSMMCT
jgi:hypothetical protein